MNHQLLQTRLEAMIAATPETELDFIQALNKVLENSFYKAPELIGDCYIQVMNILQKYFGDYPPTLDWQKEVAKEWMKQLDETKI